MSSKIVLSGKGLFVAKPPSTTCSGALGAAKQNLSIHFSSKSNHSFKNNPKRNVNRIFKTIFQTEEDPAISDTQKIQSLLLLHKMRGQANLTSLGLDACDLKKQLLLEDAKNNEIPFTDQFHILKLFSKMLSKEAKEDFFTLKEELKIKPYIFGEKRPKFLMFKIDNVHLPIIKNILHERHDTSKVGAKCPEKNIVYDFVEKVFMESNYSTIDHVDPWSQILSRLSDFVNFVNHTPPQVKMKFTNIIKKHYSDFFLVEKDGSRIIPSRFLNLCLYNEIDNLVLLNQPENGKKGSKDFALWAEHRRLSEKLISKISYHPESTLDSLFDKTGFIYKFKNDESIVENFRGKGLGETLIQLEINENNLSPSKRLKRHSLKSQAVLNGFESTIHELRKLDYEEYRLESLAQVTHQYQQKLCSGDESRLNRNKHISLFRYHLDTPPHERDPLFYESSDSEEED